MLINLVVSLYIVRGQQHLSVSLLINFSFIIIIFESWFDALNLYGKIFLYTTYTLNHPNVNKLKVWVRHVTTTVHPKRHILPVCKSSLKVQTLYSKWHKNKKINPVDLPFKKQKFLQNKTN